VTIESVPYAVLMEANSVLVESYPVPGKLKTEIGTELANRFEWRYYLRGQSGGKLKPGEGKKDKRNMTIGQRRKMKINREFHLQPNPSPKWVRSYASTVKISCRLSLTETAGRLRRSSMNTLNF